MGQPGGADAQYLSDGQGASGRLTSKSRVGAIYGCDPGSCEPSAETDRLYVVGLSRTEQGTDADEPGTSDPSGTASFTAVGLQRLFRLQAFQ